MTQLIDRIPVSEADLQRIAKLVYDLLDEHLREEVIRQTQILLDYRVAELLERGVNAAVRARIERAVDEHLVVRLSVKGGA